MSITAKDTYNQATAKIIQLDIFNNLPYVTVDSNLLYAKLGVKTIIYLNELVKDDDESDKLNFGVKEFANESYVDLSTNIKWLSYNSTL